MCSEYVKSLIVRISLREIFTGGFSVKILISFCPFAARREHATRGTELNAANTVVSGSLREKQRGTSVIPMFPDVSSNFFLTLHGFVLSSSITAGVFEKQTLNEIMTNIYSSEKNFYLQLVIFYSNCTQARRNRFRNVADARPF